MWRRSALRRFALSTNKTGSASTTLSATRKLLIRQTQHRDLNLTLIGLFVRTWEQTISSISELILLTPRTTIGYSIIGSARLLPSIAVLQSVLGRSLALPWPLNSTAGYNHIASLQYVLYASVASMQLFRRALEIEYIGLRAWRLTHLTQGVRLMMKTCNQISGLPVPSAVLMLLALCRTELRPTLRSRSALATCAVDRARRMPPRRSQTLASDVNIDGKTITMTVKDNDIQPALKALRAAGFPPLHVDAGGAPITIAVGHMCCAHCVTDLKQALVDAKIEALNTDDMTLGMGKLVVKAKEGKTLDLIAVTNAMEAGGFSATKISMGNAVAVHKPATSKRVAVEHCQTLSRRLTRRLCNCRTNVMALQRSSFHSLADGLIAHKSLHFPTIHLPGWQMSFPSVLPPNTSRHLRISSAFSASLGASTLPPRYFARKLSAAAKNFNRFSGRAKPCPSSGNSRYSTGLPFFRIASTT